MNAKLYRSAGLVVILAFAMVMTSFAQDKKVTKKTEVIQNADGTYSVIEYPAGKEVMVNLLPSATVTGGKGVARVVRSADGTKVFLDVNGVPATTANYYTYVVDPAGVPTLLGPLAFKDGVAKAEFSTPLSQFMIVLSPNEGLTAVDPTTIAFQSEVPVGYVVVPKRISEKRTVEVANPAAVAAYDVPMLNVPTFGETEKEVKLKFDGELNGLEAKAYIARGKGTTKVKMRFDDMKKVPKDKRFTLWASAPDGTYTKLGQVINSSKRNEAQIASETSLTDFGLFITVEDAEVALPTSRIYSVFRVVPTG